MEKEEFLAKANKARQAIIISLMESKIDCLSSYAAMISVLVDTCIQLGITKPDLLQEILGYWQREEKNNQKAKKAKKIDEEMR
jgi:hypothetical protein